MNIYGLSVLWKFIITRVRDINLDKALADKTDETEDFIPNGIATHANIAVAIKKHAEKM